MLSGACIKYIWIAGFFYLTNAIPRQNPSREIVDDVAVYNAVIKSVKEWQLKQDAKKNTNRTKREEPSVCYEGLGCFEASGPFGYLDMLPSKPEEINTRFLLYPARTRQRRSGSAPTEIPFEKLEEAFVWAKGGFNKSLPTKVLIHGFGSDCGYIWAYEIRSALMAVEEINTICVDWSNGAALPNYVKASANTRLVGKQLSLLLRGLVEKNGLSLVNTHLIGFSLGAHIAGFAGADLGNLSRITGLDPAGPLFEAQDTRARLDETDAAFVDVIHSNGENLILGGLGSSQPMGHVDFYPNGGRMQKGCSHLFVGAVSDIIWSSAVEGRSLCNHRRAYKFFIDSVSPRCHFPAFPCDTYDNFLSGKCFPCTEERKCGNMGYYADRSKGRGQLYLITREEEPFCAHQYLVKIETSSGKVPVKSYGKIQVTLIGDSFLNETFTLTQKDDEEMKLGQSISKIVVLHPILSQPTKIEILYTAYSGWLSSGLTQWKIDKVTLMDSFGKISSICKRALILESGIPVILPLHPKDCDVKKSSTDVTEETKLDQAESVHPGYLENKVSEEKSNSVEGEGESSRAFNTRVVKADKLNRNDIEGDGITREVVEPILKTHSVKNGRSHVPSDESRKSEITEPILGPTTARTKQEPKEREDDGKSLKGFGPSQPPNPLDAIVTTVQFLPQRLARMFEQAEKYARETILPLVSNYTPRFITEFIGPRPEPKYVPLHYEEESSSETTHSSRSRSLPESFQDNLVASTHLDSVQDTTTPYTHIQRITKKGRTENEDDSSESTNFISQRADADVTSTNFPISNFTNTNDKPGFRININYDVPGKTKRQNQDENLITHHGNRTLMQSLASSLQNIPDNFARMLVQVQNYTRRNILPFMQTGRLTDLIWIRPKPNSTVVVDRKTIDNGTMQGKNFSFSWTVSRDFTSTEKVGIEVPTQSSTTTDETTTTESSSTEMTSSTTSTSTTTVKPLTDTTTLSTMAGSSSTEMMSSTTSISTTTVMKSTTSEKSFWPTPETSTKHHIQRIPKRGEPSLITIPQPFTIVINPDDLTTSSPKPVITTTPVPKRFESYVQKIPPKRSKEKPFIYTVIRKHPWVRDFKIGEKVVMVHNSFGGRMRYRINPDGRYEVW